MKLLLRVLLLFLLLGTGRGVAGAGGGIAVADLSLVGSNTCMKLLRFENEAVATRILNKVEDVYYLKPGSNNVRFGNIELVETSAGIVWREARIIPNSVDEIKHLLITDNSKAFFWSGKTNGIGGEVKAMEIAKSKGGTTLEGLLNEKNIELPPWDPSNPAVMKLWEDVSAEYARQVSGEVRAVIGQDLRPGNIWQSKELPALMENTNVTKITTIDPETLIEKVIFTRQ